MIMVSLHRPLALISFFRSSYLVRGSFLATRRLCLGSGLAVVSSSVWSSSNRASASGLHLPSACAAPLEDSSESYKQAYSTMQASSSTDPTLHITGYLNAEDAAALDVDLMSTPGFSLEQLMELAGLSVAECVYSVLEETRSHKSTTKTDTPHILVICGPGNNGGDGLVAARHLVLFGYSSSVTVLYPKPNTKLPHFTNLVQQCKDIGIDVIQELPASDSLVQYTAIVDAIFGFSFHGTPREPFASILERIKQAQAKYGVMTISVDIPSGWNVNGNDDDDEDDTPFHPNVLISLTAPKLAARSFRGRHFVGGRFLPPALAEKYNVQMPPYPGVSQVMELPSAEREESWEEGYAAYCAQKEAVLNAEQNQPRTMDGEPWEAQYAEYLAEKETKEFGTT